MDVDHIDGNKNNNLANLRVRLGEVHREEDGRLLGGRPKKQRV